MKRTLLVTGCAGFVASHFIEHVFKNTEDDIIGVDSLNYSGTLDRLRDIELVGPDGKTFSPLESSRFRFFSWDIRLAAEPNLVRELEKVTHIVHMAAESHVDSSITDPMKFVMANTVGTTNVLELARKLHTKNMEVMVNFSTDECFGPAPMDPSFTGFKETDRLNPTNPYAASKAGAEMLANAYANTYEVPIITTNGMNIIGERQHYEKFLPKVINYVLDQKTLPIHANPDRTQAGYRTYIHARNVASAVLFLLDQKPYLKFPVREMQRYNIVGEQEMDNLSFALAIADLVGSPLQYELVDFHSSRRGHDLKYSLDGSRMRGLGWTPPRTLHQSLKKTVEWYLRPDNAHWLGRYPDPKVAWLKPV